MMAFGFPCPRCEQDRVATVLKHDKRGIFEVQCGSCGQKWGIERAVNGTWMHGGSVRNG